MYIDKYKKPDEIRSGLPVQNTPRLLDTIVRGLFLLFRGLIKFPSIIRVRFDQDPRDLEVCSFAILRPLVLLISARSSTHQHLRRLAFGFETFRPEQNPRCGDSGVGFRFRGVLFRIQRKLRGRRLVLRDSDRGLFAGNCNIDFWRRGFRGMGRSGRLVNGRRRPLPFTGAVKTSRAWCSDFRKHWNRRLGVLAPACFGEENRM